MRYYIEETPSNAQEVQDLLLNALAQWNESNDIDSEGEGEPASMRVTTFQEGGVLTTDAGFEVCFDNGEEYQISIVRSR